MYINSSTSSTHHTVCSVHFVSYTVEAERRCKGSPKWKWRQFHTLTLSMYWLGEGQRKSRNSSLSNTRCLVLIRSVLQMLSNNGRQAPTDTIVVQICREGWNQETNKETAHLQAPHQANCFSSSMLWNWLGSRCVARMEGVYAHTHSHRIHVLNGR
jgi:hypothetical protein